MDYASTVLITGGTTGLGYQAALSIAKQTKDARIIIAARSVGDQAATTINSATGRTSVAYQHLNLSSLANVREFAAAFSKANHSPISVLLLNAGVQNPGGVTFTPDGIETTFGVNHVGHALLFHLLVPHLAPDARIIITSSGTHDPVQKTGLPDAYYDSADALAHPSEESQKNNSGRQRYATSKLVNVLWMHALDRHRKELGRSFTVVAMDPGLMPGTHLARDAGAVAKFVWYRVLPKMIPIIRRVAIKNTHSPSESGQALAWLAVSEEAKNISGKYFEGKKEIDSSKDSYDTGKQADVWKWTVEFVSNDDVEKEKFERLD